MNAVFRAPEPKDFDRLKEIPLFSRVDHDCLQDLLVQDSIQTYGVATTLFNAGDEADCFYAVLHGAVHLMVLTEDGSEGVVRIIRAGESFAEAAMFGSGRFPVNAEAQPDTVLVRVDKARVMTVIGDRPELLVEMFEALAAHQAFLMEEVHRLRTQSPAQRLASYLLTVFEVTDWEGKGQLPLHKQLIAGRIGVDPATLSRVLRRLEPAGILCRGNDVQVADIDRLRAYCESFGGRSSSASL